MEKNREIRLEKILHGGDYNPEQWLDSPEILERDLELFLKADIMPRIHITEPTRQAVITYSVSCPKKKNPL
ncbi:hypothetical protein CG709_04980, partial [Lachnotalea glycerini]